MKRKIQFIYLLLFASTFAKAQYVSGIYDYLPAPGQYTNDTIWGCDTSPKSLLGNLKGTVCLGSFGGYIVFSFENPVENNPHNPFGVDFTIFGNPYADWAEPGIVSVMKDENKNGLPDDIWYELAGSDYFFSSTEKNYSVTYYNPNQEVATNVPWKDSQDNSGVVLANSYHKQPYYPNQTFFPEVNADDYSLTGTKIAFKADTSASYKIINKPRAFGYADNNVKGQEPYTTPDNPYTEEIENSGGDAFDISWAVDSEGNYVDLDAIDFVKVHSATLASGGLLGEISTEITGAVVVEPNSSFTGQLDMIVIKDLPKEITSSEYKIEAFVFHKGRLQTNKKIKWYTEFEHASISEENVLQVDEAGEFTLVATLEDNPDIYTMVNVRANPINSSTNIDKYSVENIQLYPNPCNNYFRIKGIEKAAISIISISGKLMKKHNYTQGDQISIESFPNGQYLVHIQTERQSFVKKISK